MTKLQNLIYLGPEGSYTEVAAETFTSAKNQVNYNRIIKNSIAKVIEAVDNSNGDVGVVPIENSIEGIVRETLDNLIKTTSRVMLNGEVLVPISHCLISKAENISEIENIISISQALAQCRGFIEKNIPNAEIHTATSTSEAVKSLKDLPKNYAAIGSAHAANVYGHKILAMAINDEKDNLTRFVSLGSSIPSPTGKDKTSIALTICNKPGALVEILSVFQQNNINLSYIESRPSRRVFGDYTFFIDLEGHIEDENVQRAIGKITPFVHFYRFLGSYPRAEMRPLSTL